MNVYTYDCECGHEFSDDEFQASDGWTIECPDCHREYGVEGTAPCCWHLGAEESPK